MYDLLGWKAVYPNRPPPIRSRNRIRKRIRVRRGTTSRYDRPGRKALRIGWVYQSESDPWFSALQSELLWSCPPRGPGTGTGNGTASGMGPAGGGAGGAGGAVAVGAGVVVAGCAVSGKCTKTSKQPKTQSEGGGTTTTTKPPTQICTNPASGPFYRGATAGEQVSFRPQSGEYKINPDTGLVRSGSGARGVSVETDPNEVRRFGRVPHEIDPSYVPCELTFRSKEIVRVIMKSPLVPRASPPISISSFCLRFESCDES
jgi:hypothetical protein